MAFLLPHLHSGWHVDQAILSEDARLVVIRFGRDHDPTCMRMDETLAETAELLKNMAVFYLVDLDEVPDFNAMYELVHDCTIMFFWRNKHMLIDSGSGNNNKITWAIDNKQEWIDLVETVYRGARKGKALVTSPRDYSAYRTRV
jgi:DIM1 family U5 snRNP protein